MQDPIADMLTRIRNGQQANHIEVSMMSSILKENIVKVLKDEGYISDYRIESLDNNTKKLTVTLKYFKGQPVISRIKRISKPGIRTYKSVSDIKPIPGFGISILSTSKGVLSHSAARALNVGGEVICEVA
jgi:small subunit ribosomal protein S8